MMTPDQLTAYVAPLVGLVVAALYKWDAKRTENRRLAADAVRANDIAEKLDAHDRARSAALSALKIQQNQIHSLVNSGVQELRRLYMVATNRLFRLTTSEDDAKLASEATLAYHEHLGRQENIDTAKDIGEQISRGDLTVEELEAIMAQLKLKAPEPKPATL